MATAFLKSSARASAKFVAAATLAATALVTVGAQTAPTVNGRLRLDSIERLAPKADETVSIEIDGFLMKFAAAALSDKDPDERNVKEIIAGLRGVYVKSYEFKSGGRFTDADLAPLRVQLSAPGWSRIVDVKSRGEDEDNAEIYVATEGGRVEGMAILCVEPKELTVINIVGSIDADKLRKLEGNLGIPRIHVARKRGTGKREP
jgi:hypothetical protein